MVRKMVALGILASLPSGAYAEGQGFGLKAGALGLGLEYTYQLNDRIAFRGGINGSQFGFDDEESGIAYDFDLVWDSLSLAVDVHPLKSALRLTAGLLSNDNRLEAGSRPTGNVTIGDTVYTPQQVGAVEGHAAFDDGLFLGVGWDWSRNKRFGVSLDLGVLDQGAPIVSLTANGMLASDPAFQADIAAEKEELQDSLADLDVVPYATLGFVFRF